MIVARFYSNENFPIPVVEVLRDLGHDVLTIQAQGRAGEAVADEDVLKFAAEDRRAVLTLNRRDFIRLHNNPARSPHAGVIVCTVDSDFAGQAQRIHEEIERVPDLRDQLIRINRPLK